MEILESDITKIALYLWLGLPAIRKEFRNNILAYVFKREDVNEAIERLKGPESEAFRKYIQTFKSLQAEATALRQTNVRK